MTLGCVSSRRLRRPRRPDRCRRLQSLHAGRARFMAPRGGETCINSGVPQEVPAGAISTISGPGACGIDYPLKVSELGVSGPLGYDDEPMQPPARSPTRGPAMAGLQSQPLPPAQRPQPSPYGPPEEGPPPYDADPMGHHSTALPPYARSRPSRAPSPTGSRDADALLRRTARLASQTGTPMSLSPPEQRRRRTLTETDRRRVASLLRSAHTAPPSRFRRRLFADGR